jgi:hypothetical protein
VSGNSAYDNLYINGPNRGGLTPTLLHGGGIVVIKDDPSNIGKVKAYNSLVLGNAGIGGADDDLALYGGADVEFTAHNSLVGGRTAAILNTTGATTGAGGSILSGGSNADGTAYTSPASLTGLRTFFTAFNTLPTADNTGRPHVADWTTGALWNFRLNNPPPGVVDGGDAAHYGFVSGGVSTDVAGASRVQSGAPDMGAYESGLIGVPIPTYTVTNAKPQGTSSYGYLTVSSATAQAGAEVTITADPASGYSLGTITYRTASGVTVPVTGGRFTMPAENVTVDATFVLGVSGGGGFPSTP